MEPWTLLIGTHAFFAALSLLLGGVNLARRTRGDGWHRLLGRAWIVSILVTSLTSFGIGGLATPMEWFLKFLACTSIVSVSIGWWAARRGRHVNHAGCMVAAYVGLLGAFVGVLVSPNRRIPSSFRLFLVESLVVTGIVVAIAVAVVLATRHAARRRA